MAGVVTLCPCGAIAQLQTLSTTASVVRNKASFFQHTLPSFAPGLLNVNGNSSPCRLGHGFQRSSAMQSDSRGFCLESVRVRSAHQAVADTPGPMMKENASEGNPFIFRDLESTQHSA